MLSATSHSPAQLGKRYGNLLSGRYCGVEPAFSPQSSDAHEHALNTESEIKPEASSHQAVHVLVVDDNRDAADMLSELLTAAGYEVKTDYHPAAALARAKVEQFDAFILDIGLPDVDGNELARRLQASQNGRLAVFIAVTGYGSDEERQLSAAAGFRYHFTKPAQLVALVGALGKPSGD